MAAGVEAAPSSHWRSTCDGSESWWVNAATGEAAWQLPFGASTACGWSQGGALDATPPPLWLHSSSGALRCLPPPPSDAQRDRAIQSALGRRAEYRRSLSGGERAFKRGKRSTGQRVWRREKEAVEDLPPGAHTLCGWWHSAASGQWVHAGSGATTGTPPPLPKAEADVVIRAHLRAVEAAEAL